MHLRESLSSALPLFRKLSGERERLETGPKELEVPPEPVRQPNRKLSPTEVDELVAAYQSGVDLSALSQRFGLHRQTARAHLRRCGVTLRSDSPVLTPAQIDELVELYASGQSTYQLAKQFGVGATTVGLALRKRGVKLRPKTGGRDRP